MISAKGNKRRVLDCRLLFESTPRISENFDFLSVGKLCANSHFIFGNLQTLRRKKCIKCFTSGLTRICKGAF